MNKFPIGISVLDELSGGIPAGLIILAEDVGAGGKEFALTSLMKYPNPHYVTITQNPDELLRDLELYFPKRDREWLKNIKIFSLSKEFFAKTIVPLSWISEEASLSLLKSENVLEKLVNFFDEIDEGNMVFVDSLTDLVRKTELFGNREIEWRDLVDFLIGLRKLSVKRNLLIYFLLTKSILDEKRAEEIYYTADGVLIFEWIIERDKIKRVMYIRKLLGVLPILEKQKIQRYDISIDPEQGLVISRLERII